MISPLWISEYFSKNKRERETERERDRDREIERDNWCILIKIQYCIMVNCIIVNGKTSVVTLV
jgi:hypothetical protein